MRPRLLVSALFKIDVLKLLGLVFRCVVGVAAEKKSPLGLLGKVM